MKYIIPIICLLCSGCIFTRTIYVPDGQSVRMRQTVKNAKVWVLTEDKQTVEGRLDIPEGWYCLPK